MGVSGGMCVLAAAMCLVGKACEHLRRVRELEQALDDAGRQRPGGAASGSRACRPGPTSKLRRGRQLVPSEDPDEAPDEAHFRLGSTRSNAEPTRAVPTSSVARAHREPRMHELAARAREVGDDESVAWGGSGRSLVGMAPALLPPSSSAPMRFGGGNGSTVMGPQAELRRDRDGWTDRPPGHPVPDD